MLTARRFRARSAWCAGRPGAEESRTPSGLSPGGGEQRAAPATLGPDAGPPADPEGHQESAIRLDARLAGWRQKNLEGRVENRRQMVPVGEPRPAAAEIETYPNNDVLVLASFHR